MKLYRLFVCEFRHVSHEINFSILLTKEIANAYYVYFVLFSFFFFSLLFSFVLNDVIRKPSIRQTVQGIVSKKQ
jgi:hypothetical protein